MRTENDRSSKASGMDYALVSSAKTSVSDRFLGIKRGVYTKLYKFPLYAILKLIDLASFFTSRPCLTPFPTPYGDAAITINRRPQRHRVIRHPSKRIH